MTVEHPLLRIFLCLGFILLTTASLHGQNWQPVPMCAIYSDSAWRLSVEQNAWMICDDSGQWREGAKALPLHKWPEGWPVLPFRGSGEYFWWVDFAIFSPPLLGCGAWTIEGNRVRGDEGILWRVIPVNKVKNDTGPDKNDREEFTDERAGGTPFYRRVSGLSMVEWPLINSRGNSYRRLVKTMIRNGTPRNIGETQPYSTRFDFVPLPDDQIQVYVLQPPLIGVWHGQMTHKRATLTLGEKTIESPSIAVHWKLVRTYQTPFAESFHVVTDGDNDLFVVPKQGIFGVGDVTGVQQPKLQLNTSLTLDNDGRALGDFTMIVSDLDRQRTYIIVGERYLEIQNLQIAEQWTDLDRAPQLIRACCLPLDDDKCGGVNGDGE